MQCPKRMLKRLEFYREKIYLLAYFIWWREWKLAREEFMSTYQEYLDVEVNSDKLCQEAAARLLKAVEELPDSDQKLPAQLEGE